MPSVDLVISVWQSSKSEILPTVYYFVFFIKQAVNG